MAKSSSSDSVTGQTPGKHINNTILLNKNIISNLVVEATTPTPWKSTLQTPSALRCSRQFGQPDTDHSVTQEACAETTIFLSIKSGYFDTVSLANLCASHVLIAHMARQITALETYDFRWLQNTDTQWVSQTTPSVERRRAMTACLFHYNLDVSLLMRYLGGNYTGAHRNVQATAQYLLDNGIDDDLVHHYIRIMTVGCPRIMNADISRENALLYWRMGNNPSVEKNLPSVKKTMNKDDKNKFVISIPSWLWRFIPHLFATPQHLHQKPGKKDRMIFDAKYMHTPDSISVNMMTEDASQTELHCDFGLVKLRLYTRLYNLRITYPFLDLFLHANDVKSCFRQLKHHPDVMSAFSFIISDTLFLQCALTFGSDFSPASWEVLRRIIEQLAEALFGDDTLIAKHRQILDQMHWQRSLGSSKAKFIAATPCAINTGVLDAAGTPSARPMTCLLTTTCTLTSTITPDAEASRQERPASKPYSSPWVSPTLQVGRTPSPSINSPNSRWPGSTTFWVSISTLDDWQCVHPPTSLPPQSPC